LGLTESEQLRKARRELAEARQHLELILESTSEGIYGVDTAGVCTFVSGSAASMLGYTRNELLGKNMHALIHHTNKNGRPYPVEECPIYTALAQGQGCQVDDELFFRADGSSFAVEYLCYPITEPGKHGGAVITFHDIGYKKRMEAALKDAEAKYRGLFDHVSEGVYQTSPAGELLAANPALIRMLGYQTASDLRALDVNELYADPADRAHWTGVLEGAGQLSNVELHLRRKDGTVIRVVENARAVRDERGKVLYYEGTLTQVPEKQT